MDPASARAMVPCALCGKEMAPWAPWPHDDELWRGVAYCSKECRHQAGDRSACVGWNCGCTKYAKKRRLLTRHREEMRWTSDFISRHELDDVYTMEVESSWVINPFCLGFHKELDEDSDQEDPELALREALAKSNEALAEKSSFVEAATAILEARGHAIELERSRMQMEDFRAQLIRKQ